MTTTSPVRRANARQITLWVDADIVDRWDAFARSYGHNRTSLIVAGVNEFIHEHAAVPAETTTATTQLIEQRFNELQQLLQQKTVTTEHERVQVMDPHLRERILRAIEMQPATSDSLAFLLGIDEHVLVETLIALREDQIVRIDRDGVWHVVDQ